MEATVRPINCARDVSMLDRIEMNVIDMALEIGVIANRVFPITALPNTFLSLTDFACGSGLGIKAA